jgi:CHAD domain-containing protein
MSIDRQASENADGGEGDPAQTAMPASLYAAASERLAAAVDAALDTLHQESLDDRDVHTARRSLKKARAALRLLRPVWGENRYRMENHALRDAGRCLSPLRDARAVLDGFEELSQRVDEDGDAAPALSAVRAALEQELRLARRLMRRPSEPLERCVDLLEAHRIRRRVAESALTDRAAPATDATREALRTLYRKARRQLDRAEAPDATNDASALHEWRKRVKYLLNAVEELRSHLGPRADKLISRTDAIADVLGSEHDLAVLAARIEVAPTGHRADGGGAAMDALRRIIARRRAKLRRRALAMGRRAYDRRPSRFIDRLMEDAPMPAQDVASAEPVVTH